MFINRSAIFALLIPALISQAKAGHPFDFFEGTLDDSDDCLKLNNISLEEYQDFQSYDNLENLLSEAVELNYKCNIKCQLKREPTKWLNELGTLDLESMNATSEAAEYITECMDNAPDEPCAYAYKLVICSFKSGHTDFGSDESNEDISEAGHPFDFFEGTLDDFNDCLKLNNISVEEYQDFQSYDNMENLLSEAVELNYKCNIKCQLEREPTKWLNELGTIDVESMNATSEAAEYITECMENAPDEPCAYAYKLVICSFKSGHSYYKFEPDDDTDIDNCLKLNNISYEEIENITKSDYWENHVIETVEPKVKCIIKCHMESEPKWLNKLAKYNSESINATSEEAEYITKCMDNASDEPCDYAFKLFLCVSFFEHETKHQMLEETTDIAAEQQVAQGESDVIDINH